MGYPKKDQELPVKLGLMTTKEYASRNKYFSKMFGSFITEARQGAPQGKFKADVINTNGILIAVIGAKMETLAHLLKLAYHDAVGFRIE